MIRAPLLQPLTTRGTPSSQVIHDIVISVGDWNGDRLKGSVAISQQ